MTVRAASVAPLLRWSLWALVLAASGGAAPALASTAPDPVHSEAARPAAPPRPAADGGLAQAGIRVPTERSGEFLAAPSAAAGGVGDAPADNTPWPPEPEPSPAGAPCSAPLTGSHRTYNVGPDQPYAELTEVPWLSLTAGDVVNIFHRPHPYRTKFGLRAQGTADAPVVINGVTDSRCQRPEISGERAVTAADAARTRFGAEIEPLGLIQIHRLPTDPEHSHKARHLRIQNLKLSGTHHRNTFQDASGRPTPWHRFAAAIYAVRVSHLTVENCEITGNNQGVFTNSRGAHANDHSDHVHIRRNRIHLNGSGTMTEHNLYIQAYRALYEGNDVGEVAGGAGSSIKDRSSGTVIRYNRIVSGARALDLVETEEEEVSTLLKDPLYHTAWVYGNLIVNDIDRRSFSTRLFHWGFDNNPARSRAGTLHFYNNTVVNRSAQKRAWYVTLFHMNKGIPPGAQVEARSNIFANEGDSEFQFLTEAGRLRFRGVNHVPVGWTRGQPGVTGTIDTQGATLLASREPGLASDGGPPGASSIVLGHPLGHPEAAPDGADLRALQIRHQIRPGGLGWVPRPATPSTRALGAFDRRP